MAVFSFHNWDTLYGHYPFRSAQRKLLASCDGQPVTPLGNGGYYLNSLGPSVFFDALCAKDISTPLITRSVLESNDRVFDRYLMVRRKEMVHIPFSFKTPVAILQRNSMTFFVAMASVCGLDGDGYMEFNLHSRPIPTNLVSKVLQQPMCDGFVRGRDDLMIYYFSLDWLISQIQSYRKILNLSDSLPFVDISLAEKYYSMLDGYSDKTEYDRHAKKYEEQCLQLLTYIVKLKF